MRSSPLKRGKPLARGTSQLKRTRLKPMSEKRRAQLPEYETAKFAVWERDGHRCQVALVWPEVACTDDLHPHHTWQQGKFPERRCDPEAMLVSCSAHHDAIHLQDPARARRLELLH